MSFRVAPERIGQRLIYIFKLRHNLTGGFLDWITSKSLSAGSFLYWEQEGLLLKVRTVMCSPPGSKEACAAIRKHVSEQTPLYYLQAGSQSRSASWSFVFQLTLQKLSASSCDLSTIPAD